MMRLLITRPQEDGGRLAESLVKLGHEPILLPLIEIVYPELPELPLDGVQAIIATSRNALRGLRRNAAFTAAKALPVFAVGEATAAFAADLDFAEVHVGAGTAKDLVPLIARTVNPAAGALLYLTGEHIAFDLAGVLSALRYDVRRVILYAARENVEARDALAGQLGAGLDGALLMSPRTSRVFATLLETYPPGDIRGMTCYCYSQAVAKPLEHIPGLHLSVAAHAKETDLLALFGNEVTAKAFSNPSDELLGKS
jgi:uroporphyrinogen-III synthase